MDKISSFFKNVCFAILFALGTFLGWFIGLLALSIGTKCLQKIYKKLALLGLFVLWAIYGIEHKIEGIEHTEGPCVMVSKHQSIWETLAFMALFDKVSYILKEELLKIPFYGWQLRALGMIPVKRGGGIKVMKKMLTHSKLRLSEGYKVIIFPQGTRVPAGSSIEEYPYHFSFIDLYRHGFAIVPVSLNSGVFWPKGLFSTKTAGTITVTIKPPIKPGLSDSEFKKMVVQQAEGDHIPS